MTLRRALAFTFSTALLSACHRDDGARARAKQEFERVRAEYEKRLAEQRKRAAARSPERASPPESPSAPRDAPAPSAAAGPPTSPPRDAPWIADTKVDVAPPAQATASSRGVVMNTRDGEIVIARL